MQTSPTPIVQDLVLIGGGHAHVTVLKSLGMNPVPGQRVTLVCRDILTPYSGMLPGYVAGHYSHEECHIDLGPLAAFAGARFIHDEVIGLDPVAQTLTLKNRPPLGFDMASINIGSAPDLEGVKGADQFTTPVKPITGFTARWEAMLRRVTTSPDGLRIGVVGAGAGGVELILSVQHRLEKALADHHGATATLTFHLFQGPGEILPTLPERVRDRFSSILKERGVQVHVNCQIIEARAGLLIAEDGQEFPLDEALWTTRAGAQTWLRDTGLALDNRGFVQVDDTLRSTSHPHIFAVGDIAQMVDHPREKAGVFAVRQGPPLTRNIRRTAQGLKPMPFKPQETFLTLISTGDKYAIGSKGPVNIAGRWVWRWKDHIDRKFMTKFKVLPDMPLPHAPAGAAIGVADHFEPMPCGGCGAKVDAEILSSALSILTQPDREDVLAGLDAPDDAAIVSVPDGMVQVQSIDHFRSFTHDPRIFAEIAMVHALGDIWAMGAEPQTALAMVTLPPMSSDKQRETLTEIMGAACAVLNDHGGVMIGGHTAEGPELALGFSVTGLVKPDDILRKSGLADGQALILTKPLGTGVLMAAGMRGKAPGLILEAALKAMCQGNASSARILRKFGATAMTDVTGFGLIGHMGEMIRASTLSADLDGPSIPALAGAGELAAAGIASTLLPENIKSARHLLSDPASGDKYPLLFDPQTSGGLLAGLPAASAPACLEALQAAGARDAAIIGMIASITPGEGPRINIH